MANSYSTEEDFTKKIQVLSEDEIDALIMGPSNINSSLQDYRNYKSQPQKDTIDITHIFEFFDKTDYEIETLSDKIIRIEKIVGIKNIDN